MNQFIQIIRPDIVFTSSSELIKNQRPIEVRELIKLQETTIP